MQNNPKLIIIHHTASPANWTVKDIDNDHKVRWNGQTLSQMGYYVGYHIVIDQNGYITHCRELNEEGCHTYGHNLDSIGIALIGNFNNTDPTPQQIKSLGYLLDTLCTYKKIDWRQIYAHRHFKATDCYGIRLKDTWAREVFVNYKSDIIRKTIAYLYSLIEQINKTKVPTPIFGGLHDDKDDN